MLENEFSDLEGPGIYSIAASHSAGADAVIILNYEGTNTDDPPIMAGSAFQHCFNAYSEALLVFLDN
jgi:hypothetical protein